jgi:hypothetical protein
MFSLKQLKWKISIPTYMDPVFCGLPQKTCIVDTAIMINNNEGSYYSPLCYNTISAFSWDFA